MKKTKSNWMLYAAVAFLIAGYGNQYATWFLILATGSAVIWADENWLTLLAQGECYE